MLLFDALAPNPFRQRTGMDVPELRGCAAQGGYSGFVMLDAWWVSCFKNRPMGKAVRLFTGIIAVAFIVALLMVVSRSAASRKRGVDNNLLEAAEQGDARKVKALL